MKTLEEINTEQEKVEHQSWMDMLDEEDFEPLNEILNIPFPITDEV